jgi:lipopolysaccharide transport system ATP-binding protein
MSEERAISLKNISKCYKRYTHPVDRLIEILVPGKTKAQEFWALRDINIDIFKGETLGIIGHNGSGKSTLLQIIAGTLTPTTGAVDVKGRVSALLELGSGFNLEFTGRQNVFFNGQLLGLSEAELEEKFDIIASFADIGDFLEQPVKTYSSGMFIRLAFAVAVSVEPDILIVDEALAVGDIFFQQKCFERLKKLQEYGTTILFVSHDSGAVYRLCSKALLMESGKAILHANARQVIDLYEAKLLQQLDNQPDAVEIKIPHNSAEMVTSEDNLDSKSDNSDVLLVSDSEKFLDFTNSNDYKLTNLEALINSSDVELKFFKILDNNNREIQSVISEQLIQISIGVLFLKAFEDPHIGFKIRDKTGFTVFQTNTYCMNEIIGSVVAGFLLETTFKFYVPLIEAEYTISVGVADGGFGQWQLERTLLYAHNVAVLRVLRNKDSILWWGIVNLNPSVKFSQRQTD